MGKGWLVAVGATASARRWWSEVKRHAVAHDGWSGRRASTDLCSSRRPSSNHCSSHIVPYAAFVVFLLAHLFLQLLPFPLSHSPSDIKHIRARRL